MTAVTNGLINLFHGRWSILGSSFSLVAGRVPHWEKTRVSQRADHDWPRLLAKNSATLSNFTIGLERVRRPSSYFPPSVSSSLPLPLERGKLANDSFLAEEAATERGNSCFSARVEPPILLEKPCNRACTYRCSVFFSRVFFYQPFLIVVGVRIVSFFQRYSSILRRTTAYTKLYSKRPITAGVLRRFY